MNNVLIITFCQIIRVNDSDDLEISESNVEKLAVNIEREMFNMYYTTDNKYKIKYRSLLLSLKDPKNKVCLMIRMFKYKAV